MQRRSFLKLAGVLAAGLGVGVLPSPAAPAQAVQPLLDVESPPVSRLTHAQLEEIYDHVARESVFEEIRFKPEKWQWIESGTLYTVSFPV